MKYDNLQGSNSRCEYSTNQTFQWYCYYYGMCIYICFVKCFLGKTSSGNTSSALDLHIFKFWPLREVPLKINFFQKMSNVCFYTLMKLKSSNFQLSTSIIVATLVKNMFWPLREVPLKMYFFQKMSNVCFYPRMKLLCSKFKLSTSIIVDAIVKNNFCSSFDL